MKTNLKEIYSETIKSLSNDIQGRNKYKKSVIVLLKLVPLFIVVILMFCEIYLNDTIIDYLISFISIFAGLFFALIFIVSDKYNNRKNSNRFSESNINDDENNNYINRYQNFTKQFVTQITYMILTSIALIIIFIVISIVTNTEAQEYINYSKNIINRDIHIQFKYPLLIFINFMLHIIGYFLFIQYIIMLTLLICNLYKMIIEDISK